MTRSMLRARPSRKAYCRAAAGWAGWAEWITKPILFTLDLARKAPNSGAFFVSMDGPSIAALSDEKDLPKINKLEQVPNHPVNSSRPAVAVQIASHHYF